VNGDGRQAVLAQLALSPCTGLATDEEIAQFYVRHRAAVRRFLIGACRCPAHDAEDIIQETIIRIRERYWPTVRLLEKPVAYWYTMAQRDSARQLRLRAKRFVADDPHERLLSVADPVDHFAAADLLEALCAAIGKLPTRQRQVLWLRAIDGFSEAETAAVLSIGVGSVKTHLHHARNRLRELLRDDNATREADQIL
jgi:RNA polymerase sigma factor (sigma-70 family)